MACEPREIPGWKSMLSGKGLKFGRDFYFYDKDENWYPRYHGKQKPSELLRRTVESAEQFDIKCDIRSREFGIRLGGACTVCCAVIEFPFGSVCYDSLDNIMSSLYARLFHLSVVNRTYAFCPSTCFNLDARRKFPAGSVAPRNTIPLYRIKDIPLVGLQYDESCNLSCRTCRKKRIPAPEAEPWMTELIHGEIIQHMHEFQSMEASNGDVLYSKYYRDIFLDKYKRKTLVTLTNGILLNKENWLKLEKKYKKIMLSISIDAAGKETYSLLRGGNFDLLCKNLAFMGQMRKEKRLHGLSLNFTVQDLNYHEMADFVHLGKKISADFVIFRRVQNWGTFTDEEYKVVDICDDAHPDNWRLKSILEDPVFADSDYARVAPDVRGNYLRNE